MSDIRSVSWKWNGAELQATSSVTVTGSLRLRILRINVSSPLTSMLVHHCRQCWFTIVVNQSILLIVTCRNCRFLRNMYEQEVSRHCRLIIGFWRFNGQNLDWRPKVSIYSSVWYFVLLIGFVCLRNEYFIPAMVIPLNPEGVGIGEWLTGILFSENFEGMGRGMGNSKELCAWAQFFFGIASESDRQYAPKNHDFYGVQVSPKWALLLRK